MLSPNWLSLVLQVELQRTRAIFGLVLKRVFFLCYFVANSRFGLKMLERVYSGDGFVKAILCFRFCYGIN